MKLTPQEVLDWREHPITSKMFMLFKKRREDLKEHMVMGTLEQGEYRHVSGICEAYQDVLDVSYEYFIEEGLIQEEEKDVDSNAKYEDATR